MRKGLLVLLFLSFVVMIYGTANSDDVPRITVAQLKAKLNSPELIVIDVRSPASYNGSKEKIKGDVRENPLLFGQWSQKYPKDKTIVLYCT